ncbi:DUF5610 domain-containing protein [Rhodocyclus tenuis]|uniref:DUF5610 domain-containing protein n=1 Tax=Rhodocyclus tenuis TaxID=1066 RepID=A0A840G9J8_RHOTE|nr:DUF5610 domain-containing protein [Rhodocyclus tenuis]MBB4247570.1 hypothetical protein [Rhodocyclus tenuis]
MSQENSSSAIGSRPSDPAADFPRRTTDGSSATGAASASTSSIKQARIEQNAAIIQMSLDVSISTKNQPLTLLLKTAIAGINDQLKPEFGENAIEAASASGQDNSAAGTAGRIVSLSTGFFEAYKAQHPDESADEALTNFMATIRKGFETGYGEAQKILQGLGVLQGDLASDIEKTYSLVTAGYADFEAAQRQLIKDAAAPAESPAPTASGS